MTAHKQKTKQRNLGQNKYHVNVEKTDHKRSGLMVLFAKVPPSQVLQLLFHVVIFVPFQNQCYYHMPSPLMNAKSQLLT